MAMFPVNLNFRKRDFGRCLFTIAETGLNTLEISQLACDRETNIHTATQEIHETDPSEQQLVQKKDIFLCW